MKLRSISTVGVSLLLAYLSSCVAGCGDNVSVGEQMELLQQGKARGHLVVTSDGRVGGGFQNYFVFGAGQASLSFDGDVDFADTVRHNDNVLLPDDDGE